MRCSCLLGSLGVCDAVCRSLRLCCWPMFRALWLAGARCLSYDASGQEHSFYRLLLSGIVHRQGQGKRCAGFRLVVGGVLC